VLQPCEEKFTQDGKRTIVWQQFDGVLKLDFTAVSQINEVKSEETHFWLKIWRKIMLSKESLRFSTSLRPWNF